jgi:hypothetical protein
MEGTQMRLDELPYTSADGTGAVKFAHVGALIVWQLTYPTGARLYTVEDKRPGGDIAFGVEPLVAQCVLYDLLGR